MFETFYYGVQQDLKLFIVFPILCGILRLIFIFLYHPYESLKGRWGTVWATMKYGFWWGMDYNAYIFLISMVVISLPSSILNSYAEYGDLLRTILGTIYAVIIYLAFMGKLIFYKHFGDKFNRILYMGKNADKHILLGVFFKQDHGLWIIAGLIVYVPVIFLFCSNLLQLPLVPYYSNLNSVVIYVFNSAIVLGCVAFYYWFRYGGTFLHDNKPDWDSMPTNVKEDTFLSKAAVDDLIALKMVRNQTLNDGFTRSEEELQKSINNIISEVKDNGSNWNFEDNPLMLCKRQAEGALIKKPKHIFFIVCESLSQWMFEEFYQDLHLAEGLKNISLLPTAWSIPNVLPAGNISRPSIVSLLSGVFDSQLELNEREVFWRGNLPTSLASQMKSLGYKSIYWYGGNASNGNFNKFCKAQGFDEVRSASIFCGKKAPKTWVGVYDHIFLEALSEQLKTISDPTLHFIYTTSYHGPFKMPNSILQFNPREDMLKLGSAFKKNKKLLKAFGTARYADRAIGDFIKQIRRDYPESLIIITGDHSTILGGMSGSEFLPREHSLRERYCTTLTFLHPELENIKSTLRSKVEYATHLQILPTIIELLAPKGFEYCSIQPSLFAKQEKVLATSQQWFCDGYMGSYGESVAELIKPCNRDVDILTDSVLSDSYVEMGQSKMMVYRDLTTWLVRHEEEIIR